MAIFDDARKEIVVRIVYDGVPNAGKTTNLHSLLEVLPGRVLRVFQSSDPVGERTRYFDWLELPRVAAPGFRHKFRFQLVAVPGQPDLRHRRRRILVGADAVVFVCGSARNDLREGAALLRDLISIVKPEQERTGPVGLVVQFNKQDQAATLTVADGLRALGLVPTVAGSLAQANAGVGVLETFRLAAGVAVGRARMLAQSGKLRKTRLYTETAASFYEDMLLAEPTTDEGDDRELNLAELVAKPVRPAPEPLRPTLLLRRPPADQFAPSHAPLAYPDAPGETVVEEEPPTVVAAEKPVLPPPPTVESAPPSAAADLAQAAETPDASAQVETPDASADARLAASSPDEAAPLPEPAVEAAPAAVEAAPVARTEEETAVATAEAEGAARPEAAETISALAVEAHSANGRVSAHDEAEKAEASALQSDLEPSAVAQEHVPVEAVAEAVEPATAQVADSPVEAETAPPAAVEVESEAAAHAQEAASAADSPVEAVREAAAQPVVDAADEPAEASQPPAAESDAHASHEAVNATHSEGTSALDADVVEAEVEVEAVVETVPAETEPRYSDGSAAVEPAEAQASEEVETLEAADSWAVGEEAEIVELEEAPSEAAAAAEESLPFQGEEASEARRGGGDLVGGASALDLDSAPSYEDSSAQDGSVVEAEYAEGEPTDEEAPAQSLSGRLRGLLEKARADVLTEDATLPADASESTLKGAAAGPPPPHASASGMMREDAGPQDSVFGADFPDDGRDALRDSVQEGRPSSRYRMPPASQAGAEAAPAEASAPPPASEQPAPAAWRIAGRNDFEDDVHEALPAAASAEEVDEPHALNDSEEPIDSVFAVEFADLEKEHRAGRSKGSGMSTASVRAADVPTISTGSDSGFRGAPSSDSGSSAGVYVSAASSGYGAPAAVEAADSVGAEVAAPSAAGASVFDVEDDSERHAAAPVVSRFKAAPEVASSPAPAAKAPPEEVEILPQAPAASAAAVPPAPSAPAAATATVEKETKENASADSVVAAAPVEATPAAPAVDEPAPVASTGPQEAFPDLPGEKLEAGYAWPPVTARSVLASVQPLPESTAEADWRREGDELEFRGKPGWRLTTLQHGWRYMERGNGRQELLSLARALARIESILPKGKMLLLQQDGPAHRLWEFTPEPVLLGVQLEATAAAARASEFLRAVNEAEAIHQRFHAVAQNENVRLQCRLRDLGRGPNGPVFLGRAEAAAGAPEDPAAALEALRNEIFALTKERSDLADALRNAWGRRG